MPLYTFENENTKEFTELSMSISEMEEYVKNNPDMKRSYVRAPGVIDGFHKKPDQGFRDLLKEIKKSNSRGFSKSNINVF